MRKYTVEVKAFINIEVEADTVDKAMAEACAFVEGLAPEAAYVMGWREARAEQATTEGTVLEASTFDTEDTYYVTDENGDEVRP